jgi:Holliday junction resolvase
MGAHSRRKGAAAEREIVTLARESGFPNARRSAPLQAADGQTAPDVDGIGRLWVEVKRRGKGSMYALAVEATKERAGYVPTLAYREDGGPWLAVVPLAELLKLERAALHPTLTDVVREAHREVVARLAAVDAQPAEPAPMVGLLAAAALESKGDAR